MTEENKVTDTGVESGANGSTGGEQVENGKEAKVDIQELIKQNEKLMNELKSRDKALNDKSQKLKDYEAQQEAERLAKLSTEEKLKELEGKIAEDKKERDLINAATANGVNPTTAKLLVEKVKSGDYTSFAAEMAAIIKETSTQAGEQSVNEFKSKFETSKAPDVKATNSSEDNLKSMGLL